MPAQRPRALKWLLPLVVVAAIVCVVVVIARRRAGAYKPPPLAFDGKSEELNATVIVPTLDTPMPPGKNVIWCASFQLAWNEFRDDVIGEPVKIKGAQEIADRLNNAKSTKDDLEPDSYYVKAGAAREGVIEQIQQDMAARFPDAPTPEIEASTEAFVAYAYLAANAKFTIPFFENPRPFRFGGKRVASFGIREEDAYAYHTLREQVEVLYAERTDDGKRFAIDPCKNSQPYQIILACIEPRGTLAETLDDMRTRIATWNDPYDECSIGETGIVLVPNVFWRIEHHFNELEGPDKRILNENRPIYGYWVREASQLTEFKLDRSGAALRSEAKFVCEDGGANYIFDKPFLIIMKKRGAERPFFVMWVDNAELLCKP